MQNFMKTIISAVKTWTEDKFLDKERFVNSVADWNENDSSKDSYIKNRTHWEEEKIVKTISLSGTFDGAWNWIPYNTTDLSSLWVEGNEIIVKWNGIQYNLTVRWDSAMGYNGIGNFSQYLPSAENTGEPFAIYVNGFGNTENCGIIIAAGSEEEAVEATCEISFSGTVIHKLDSKYLDLPDNIATTDDIGEVFNELNGGVNQALTNAATAQTTAEIQPDWNQTDPTAVDYIKNNPINLQWESGSPQVDDSSLLVVNDRKKKLMEILAKYPDRKFYRGFRVGLSYSIFRTPDLIETLVYSMALECRKPSGKSYSITYKIASPLRVDIQYNNNNMFDLSSYAIIYDEEQLPIAVLQVEAIGQQYCIAIYLFYQSNYNRVSNCSYCSSVLDSVSLAGMQKRSLFPRFGEKPILYKGDAVPVPTTATVGQLLSVKAVDESGKPTEWEAVDSWTIASSTEGSTKKFKLTIDDNGVLTASEIETTT